MTLFGSILHFLALLARRFYSSTGSSSSYFALILMFLVTARFLLLRSNTLKTKLKRTLKCRFQLSSPYIWKEKNKPNFNILKSVFMDGMSYRYREWTNPVAYFCTETSRSGSKATDESESNSDEGSSQGENEEKMGENENNWTAEKWTKMDEVGTDNSTTCLSSTKAVFERHPLSQITHKRKAESEKSESLKRPKPTDSLKVKGTAKQTEKITDITIKNSSESNTCHNINVTSSVSDHHLTHVLGTSSKSDVDVDEFSKISDENLSIQKSQNLKLPSQMPSSSRGKKHSVEDVHRKNSKDKSGKSSGRGRVSSRDSALKKSVSVRQTKSRETKLNQIETNKKSYPNPKKTWKNKAQDEQCNTPSDPQIRKKNTYESKSRLEPSRYQENKSSGITQDNIPNQQNMASNNNSETNDPEKHSKSSTDSNKNVMVCSLIFPEINFSAILLREQSKQLKSLGSPKLDASRNVLEIVSQFFENFRWDSINETGHTSNRNVSLKCSEFSSELEGKSKSSDLKSSSIEGPGGSSDILPCSSTGKSQATKEKCKDKVPKVKTYPGLSLQPLKVKKDARYQKKFYKEKKEINMPIKLGEVIQWAAKKPRDEITIPVSDVPPSDEKDLSIEEYQEQAQALIQSYMTIFKSEKEKKAKKEREKKSRKEQKERMRRENTGYIESSFKEESPSSESSSDSLPTSGDSPDEPHQKSPPPPVLGRKTPLDHDISLLKVSPMKPVAKVSPRLRTEPETNFAPFVSEIDCILGVDMSGREIFETVSESSNERRQNLFVQATSHASSLHQSHEILARDLSARAFCESDWILREIEFSENEGPREHSYHNIPTRGADNRIESKMEEWPAEANQSHATPPAKAEKKSRGQQSTDSPMDSMPVLFGYPSPELISKTMKDLNIPKSRQYATPPEKAEKKSRGQQSTDSTMDSMPVLFGYPSPELISKTMKDLNIPKSRQHTVSWSSNRQCTCRDRRKTKSESSICHRSNLLSVEREKSPHETQTTRDVSSLSREKPTLSTREKLTGKQSETENRTCRTENNLYKHTNVRKDDKTFKSNPIPSVSGQQESTGGYGTKAKERFENKKSSPLSSVVEKNSESIQQSCDIAHKLGSTPEKKSLSATDVLELSSDPENEDSETSKKEQCKK